jgi:hypothetical protein
LHLERGIEEGAGGRVLRVLRVERKQTSANSQRPKEKRRRERERTIEMLTENVGRRED